MNKNVIYAALMFVVTMSSGNASAQQLPYQNPALSAHERAVDLCGRLTLEEKASLMLDDSPAIPRLGIKRFQWWSEKFLMFALRVGDEHHVGAHHVGELRHFARMIHPGFDEPHAVARLHRKKRVRDAEFVVEVSLRRPELTHL